MRTKAFVAVALAVAVGLAVAVSPFASSSPDGLNKVAEDKGFLDTAAPSSIQDGSPIPGYAFPGVENERVATGLAGFVGTLTVFVLGFGLAALLARSGRGSAGGSRQRPGPDATA